jgi:hypothetical protein
MQLASNCLLVGIKKERKKVEKIKFKKKIEAKSCVSDCYYKL